mmetsp:Transcript_20145/g.29955  ORF Transcript_20145/g.29955 Transcript_20145/m.29955 type:complete len:139 (+) Transcript_20145:70-486(+)
MGNNPGKELLEKIERRESLKEIRKYLKSLSSVDAESVTHYTDLSGWTCLHHAISQERYDIVNLLIDYGADIEASTWGGETPVSMLFHRNAFDKIQSLSFIPPQPKRTSISLSRLSSETNSPTPTLYTPVNSPVPLNSQ